MPYEEDNSIVGDLELRREDFILLQEAFTRLRDELELWNGRALEHGAERPPYEREVSRLTHWIEFGNEALKGGPPFVLVRGISIGSLRYAKAALAFLLHERQTEHATKKTQGWPGAVLESLSQSLDRLHRVDDSIKYEPSDVLWEVMSKPSATPVVASATPTPVEWDVFVSHASEDSEEFARPLAE